MGVVVLLLLLESSVGTREKIEKIFWSLGGAADLCPRNFLRAAESKLFQQGRIAAENFGSDPPVFVSNVVDFFPQQGLSCLVGDEKCGVLSKKTTTPADVASHPKMDADGVPCCSIAACTISSRL